MAFTWDTAICVKYERLVANVTVPRSRLKVTKKVVKALWKVKCDENGTFRLRLQGSVHESDLLLYVVVFNPKKVSYIYLR